MCFHPLLDTRESALGCKAELLFQKPSAFWFGREPHQPAALVRSILYVECVAHGLRQAHKAAFLWASKHPQVSSLGGPSPHRWIPKPLPNPCSSSASPSRVERPKARANICKGTTPKGCKPKGLLAQRLQKAAHQIKAFAAAVC